MVAYFCHHLSDIYVDLSDLYVILLDLSVELSDIYVDLSLIHLLEMLMLKTCSCPTLCHTDSKCSLTSRQNIRLVDIIIWQVDDIWQVNIIVWKHILLIHSTCQIIIIDLSSIKLTSLWQLGHEHDIKQDIKILVVIIFSWHVNKMSWDVNMNNWQVNI